MFENIRPEDFHRETSAVKIDAIPDRVRTAGFGQFIAGMLAACRQDVESNDYFIPRGMLANSDECRLFNGEDDEVPADFARRLRREARLIGAHWMFTAMVAPARHVTPDHHPAPIDSDDIVAVERALESGVLQLGVCWRACAISNGQLEHRAGIIYLDAHGKPDHETSGEMDADMDDPFAEVLKP